MVTWESPVRGVTDAWHTHILPTHQHGTQRPAIWCHPIYLATEAEEDLHVHPCWYSSGITTTVWTTSYRNMALQDSLGHFSIQATCRPIFRLLGIKSSVKVSVNICRWSELKYSTEAVWKSMFGCSWWSFQTGNWGVMMLQTVGRC